MGTLGVVVEHPPPCSLADIIEAGKQVQVEHFLPEGPVETLDIGILVWLAGLDVADDHAVGLCPLGKGGTEEFRTIVGTKDLRQHPVALELFKDSDQARR